MSARQRKDDDEQQHATSSTSCSALVPVSSAPDHGHEYELYYLMYQKLAAGPCHRAAAALREEINQLALMPERVDWKGQRHRQTLDDVQQVHPHIQSTHLRQICALLPELVDKVSPPAVPGVHSLLGNGRHSLLRSHVPVAPLSLSMIQRCLSVRGVTPQIRHSPNLAHFICGRELSGRSNISAQSTSLYRGLKFHRRYLGHLAQIFCVMFDRTGEYILTGADDSLVKIWSASDGRLLATLRGHSAHITDFSVNFENTLLATASEDKQIRIWNLKTTAPIAILINHSQQVTSVRFCPLILKDKVTRYLVSTGNDGAVCFWKWNIVTSEFDPKPLKFIERPKAGCHILGSSFSSGGTFLAVGSTDHHIRVYHVDAPLGPTKILELEAHSDQVDSLQFCNHSLRFVSGSKDGFAHIWYYEKQFWKNISLSMAERLPHEPVIDENDLKKIRVNMVGWNCDDSLVLTTASDFGLRVWDPVTGKLLHSLREHKDDAFVVEAHPFDPRLVLTGGHDGYIIVWDIVRGVVVNKFHNMIPGQGVGAIYDAKWSRNGQTITSSDSHGHMAIIGFGSSTRHERVPDQVFFHTDYRPLVRDANSFVIDEQTQCPPHQMPPPFLVDIDGNPHPTHFQRLVPGRENSNDDQLVPYISVNNERGVNEILEPVNRDEPAAIPENPTIDDMIQLLDHERRNQAGAQQGNQNRRDHDHDYVANNGNANGNNNEPAVNPIQAADRRRNSNADNNAPRRRQGDAVAGVSQPGANWQSRDGSLSTFWMRRTVVKPLTRYELDQMYRRLNDMAQLERDYYKKEKKKKEPEIFLPVRELNPKEKLTRRKRRINEQRSGVASNNNSQSSRARNSQIRRTTGITDYENLDELSDSSNEIRLSGAESWSESTSSSESESDEESEDEEPQFREKNWHSHCKRFLDHLFRNPDSLPFRAAVDPVLYPDYTTVVDMPMDLGTVREALVAGEYESFRQFRKDIELIFNNSKTYNTERRSHIHKLTLKLETYCKTKLDSIARDQKKRIPPPKKSKTPKSRQLPKRSATRKKRSFSGSEFSEPGPSGVGTSAPSDDTEDEEVENMEAVAEDEERSPENWKQRCRELVEFVLTLPDSTLFRDPVDAGLYPDYYQLIKNPIDLGTINEFLVCAAYNSFSEFRDDMERLFANAKFYNSEGSPIYATTLRLQSLCTRRMDEIQGCSSKRRGSSSEKPKRSAKATVRRKKSVKSARSKRKKPSNRRPVTCDLSEPGPSGLCSSASSGKPGPSSRGRGASQRLTNGCDTRFSGEFDEDSAMALEKESDETEIEDNVNSGNDTDATEIAENVSSPRSFSSSVEPPSKRRKAGDSNRNAKRLKKEPHTDISDVDDVSFSIRASSRSSNETATSISTATTPSEDHDSGRRRVSYVGKGKYPAKLNARTRNGGVPTVKYNDADDETDNSDFEYDGVMRQNGQQVSSRGRLIKFKNHPRNAGQVC